ncbi:4'-phosphopantetheinyl transferase family protein [Actinomadura sp. HBU206391]|uniref:4'-phosphopantetheinyl transferase family protein n=1 Tax=Actinomadura sp. HBU206391 TaxID=2731692 RepID=UPI00164FD036|nr:4'-phosphopantetheinyl transferase superfamily protein [Actinomadura sp. HBU206391]MBC6460064.1 4'-phosphopantetheinyl transferase superfamily protein [Actinomadura sp. HBU206391]
MATAEVWWAALTDVRPWHAGLLDPVERGRRELYLREEDRDRFTIGVALTRLACGARLGVPPERVPLIRTCPDCGAPHGAPRVDGDGPRVSVSHSGDRVALAVTGGGPVGVDVESRAITTGDIEEQVLGPAELADLRGLAEGERQRGLLAYWTRKESIVKATGDGLRAPLTDLRVSAPGEAPRLLAWAGRPGLAARIGLHALDPGPGHVACLALIDQPHATVRELSAADLLS